MPIPPFLRSLYPRFRPHLLPLLILSLTVLFLTRHIWMTRAWIETHDGIFHLIRLESMVEMLRSGAFPVRWVSSLDNGLGLPLFNYMYPLPYYLTSPLVLLGLSAKWAIKLFTITIYFLGGFGIYLLTLRQSTRWHAVIAALLYLTTPYLLLNIFVRGALGEYLALSLAPWVLLSLADLARTRRLSFYHPLPFALMLLSHNFLSFLFLPVIVTYLLVFYRQRRLQFISLALSLLLAAFFVLPMLLERHYLTSFAAGDFTYLYRDHFVYLSQLFWDTWGQGHSYAGTGDGFSFALGIATISLLAWGIIKSFAPRAHAIRFYTLLTLLCLFLLLPISTFIWQAFPPLQIIQFPWRLLAFIPLATALLYVSLVGKTKHSSPLLLLLLITNLLAAYFYTIPPYYQSNDQLSTQYYIHRYQTTTSSRLELLPRWSSAEPRYIGDEHLRLDAGTATIHSLEQNPKTIQTHLTVTSDSASLRLRRNYFPSWQLVDQTGNTHLLTPTSDGEISVELSAGEYYLTFRPGSTPLETFSNYLSLSTLLALVLYSIWFKIKSL